MILSDAAVMRSYREQGAWGDATLDDLFRRSVVLYGDSPALVDAPNRETFSVNPPRRLSYRELDRAVTRLADRFIGLGLVKDDVIAVQLPNVAEQVVVLLAGLRAGLIVAPLPLMWRAHELEIALPLIAPKALIAMAAHGFDGLAMMQRVAVAQGSIRHVLAFGPDLPEAVVALDHVFDRDGLEVADPLPVAVSPDDIAMITWAGGDCPAPCPVPRSHNQWIAAGLMTLLEAGLEDRCVMLNPYPLTGLVPVACFWVPWLLTGGTLVLHHPFELAVFVDQVDRERPVYTGLPPTVIDVIRSENIFAGENGVGALAKLACIWPAPVLIS
jgi:non-ribosomal peptide synthetase component E (peptide arylation enzyme)